MTLRAALLALLILLSPALLAAQMTVEGRVTDRSGAPVAGASVSINSLNISVRTSTEGRYNFIIRQAQVRGQLVEMVARHSRFGSQTTQLQITGGSVSRDFVLGTNTLPPSQRGQDTLGARMDRARDTSTFGTGVLGRRIPIDRALPSDVPSALAGQYAPLAVNEANTAGGSTVMNYRGTRSLFGNTQPLVVVDGVPIDNIGFTTTAQRFGQGGYDYGTPLQDLAPEDVGSIELLDPATAALEYGGRAANGVLRITTRDGRDIAGLQFTVTSRLGFHQAARLPAYQNVFGQGLGGEFEFFDGRGGGINDAVAQSWGPRLDGRPLAQHSLSETGRPDVRFWLPRPDGVRNYFTDVSDLDLALSVLGSRGPAHFRAAINARDADGLTPGASLRRLGGTLGGEIEIAPRATVKSNLQVIRGSASQRPGTGFDEVNPVAGFTRFGRQVDIDALRDTVVDSDGNQINWIYTARNNPFFATSLNANEDERTQILAGGSLAVEVARWLTMSLHAGVSDYTETRTINVANGWRGGFPTSLGRGDFGGGGVDRSSFSAGEQFLDIVARARHGSWRGTRLTSAAGAGLRRQDFGTRASVTDRPLVGAPTVTSRVEAGRDDVRSIHAQLSAVRHENFTLTAGARLEQYEFADRTFSTAFPSVSLSYDAARRKNIRERLGLGQARLHASIWRSGNEVGTRTLTRAYYGGVPIAPINDISGPERTTGVQVGTVLGTTGGRITFELTGYRERSTSLLVTHAPGDGSAAVAQTGQIFNSGFEGGVHARVLQGAVAWELAGSFSRNVNTVDGLRPGLSQVALAPELFGARSAARVGLAAGVILGSRQLRDGNGALLLRNGLPLPDANSPLSILGSAQPDWTATLRSHMRYRGVDVVALFDARIGGSVFSATNLWGSYAGTLESTLIGDRATAPSSLDSLVIVGIDSITGASNSTRVSAEQYFHALGEITEPWVFDASTARIRMLQIGYDIPTRMVPGLREHVLRLSLVARNFAVWSKAPNIEPGLAISSHAFHGFEMGQLPGVRSVGVIINIAP